MAASVREKSWSRRKHQPIPTDCFGDVRLTPLEELARLKINDTEFLNCVESRSLCPKCKKSRRFYCYSCYVPMETIAGKIPFLKLPIKIDIIKHPNEIDGKSTAAHAAILAPDDVTIYTFPNFPDYSSNPNKVLLVFPSEQSRTLREWCSIRGQSLCASNSQSIVISEEKLSELTDLSLDTDAGFKSFCRRLRIIFGFEKLVFIDSTWHQVKSIYNHPSIKELPCLVLDSHTTCYWRYHRGNPRTHLSTIESIYYCLRDLFEIIMEDCTVLPPLWENGATVTAAQSDNVASDFNSCLQDNAGECSNVTEGGDLEVKDSSEGAVRYDGRYDNLLLFFKYMLTKIHVLYDAKLLRVNGGPGVAS